MKNVLLTGYPRSGMGSLAEALRPTGYNIVQRIPLSNAGNPLDVNNELLARILDPSEWDPEFDWLHMVTNRSNRFGWDRPDTESNALAFMPPEPFVLVDPRFCYLYPVWKQYVENETLIVLYRHPVEVFRSILESINSRMWPDVTRDMDVMARSWNNHYTYLLTEKAVFLRFDQLSDTRIMEAMRLELGIERPESLLPRISTVRSVERDTPVPHLCRGMWQSLEQRNYAPEA
jgi:hypothetical protein